MMYQLHVDAARHGHISTYIYLDGDLLKDALEANERDGWVVLARKDAHGCYEYDGHGNYLTERREGQVMILTGRPLHAYDEFIG